MGIHGDGAGAGGRGFHVITSSLDLAGPEVAAGSAALASAVRDAMTAVEPVSTYTGSGGLDSRPDLAGLNLNAVPAVYVECGNMRNAADAALMSSPDGREAIAGAAVRRGAGLPRPLAVDGPRAQLGPQQRQRGLLRVDGRLGLPVPPRSPRPARP